VAGHEVERADGQEAHTGPAVVGDDVALAGMLTTDEVLTRPGHEHAVRAVPQRGGPVTGGADEVSLDDRRPSGDAKADAGAVVAGDEVAIGSRGTADAHVPRVHEDAAAVVGVCLTTGPVHAHEVAHHAAAVRTCGELDAAGEVLH